MSAARMAGKRVFEANGATEDKHSVKKIVLPPIAEQSRRCHSRIDSKTGVGCTMHDAHGSGSGGGQRATLHASTQSKGGAR